MDVPLNVKVRADLSDLKNQLQGLSISFLGGAKGKSEGEKSSGGAVNLLSAISAQLIALVAALGVISAIFSSAFGNLFKILNAIFKLIGKMVEPFVNLLIPILIPVLMVLGVMARIFNTLLRPLFTIMMKIFGGVGKDLGVLVGQFLADKIDFGQFLGGLSELVGKAIDTLLNSPEFQKVKEQLLIMLAAAAEALRAFLELDPSALKSKLEEFLGPALGGAIAALINVFHFVASALVGFVAQLTGKGFFDQILGAGEFDKLKEQNKGFSSGVDIGKAIQDIWDALVQTTVFLIDVVIPALDGWIKGGVALVLDPLSRFAYNIYPPLESAILKMITFVLDIATNVWPSVKSTLLRLIDAVNSFLNLISNFKLPSFDLGKREEAPEGSFNDFIIRPNSQPVSFSPQDTVFGVKNPSDLTGGGGSTFNNTININGTNLSQKELEGAVKQALEQTMSQASRSGRYQRGY